MFDPDIMDTETPACKDFYRYACGGWNDRYGQAVGLAWGRYEQAEANTRKALSNLIDIAVRGKAPVNTRIRTFLTACEDSRKINAVGRRVLDPQMRWIDSITDRTTLARTLARLQEVGVSALFSLSVGTSSGSMKQIAIIDQPVLPLPVRQDYLKADRTSRSLRGAYRNHIRRMLRLAGVPASQASRDAEAVLSIEMQLARIMSDEAIEKRLIDPGSPRTAEQLFSAGGGFAWADYFDELGLAATPRLAVAGPQLAGAISLVAERDVEDLKGYLRWRLVSSTAATLGDKFLQEAEHFYIGSVLQGRGALLSRGRRCQLQTRELFPGALGRLYAEKAVAPGAREQARSLVEEVRRALKTMLSEQDWLSPATREAALAKLQKLEVNVGYPDQWSEDLPVELKSGDAYGNLLRVRKYHVRRELTLLQSSPERTAWPKDVARIVATYDPLLNQVNVLAGMLQPPFFSTHGNEASNYGALGFIAAHELIHGFDSLGRRYDGQGNRGDWWTVQDAREFEERSACLVRQYDTYRSPTGIQVEGKRTLEENIADNGGIRLAHRAFTHSRQGLTTTADADGFTAEQKFFLGFAQQWCEAKSPVQERLDAAQDFHAPGPFRVNGSLSNMPEFAGAFGCKSGDPMVRRPECRLW